MNKMIRYSRYLCFPVLTLFGLFIALSLYVVRSNGQELKNNVEGYLTTQPVRVQAGWNLLSLPVIPPDNLKQSLYPHAVSSAFIYQNGYQQADTIQHGPGFWLKFDSSETIIITGEPVYTDTIAVHDGWNMIGCVAVPFSVSNLISDPPENIISDYFGYSGVYQNTDTLQPGCGYWVKVKQNGSIVFQFQAPASPSNIYPAHGSTGQPANITLRWSCEDTNGDPLTYDVYFGTVNPPVSIVSSNQSDTTFERIGLDAGTTYYWKVVAKDNHGGAASSPVWSFTTNNPPIPPSIVIPMDSSTGQPPNVILRWKCSDPEGDPVTYDVYFGTEYPPVTLVSSVQPDTFFNPGELLAGTTYHWRIVAKDNHGDSTSSPTWRFKTNNPPIMPSIIIPADSSIGQPSDIVLRWTCSDADGDTIAYDVYVGTDNPPSTMVSSDQPDTFISRSGLLSGEIYYWKVIAKDNHGGSSSGPVWRFTTNNPPSIPSNPSPAHNSIGQVLSILLSWTSSDPEGDSLTYDVYFGTQNPPTLITASMHRDTALLQTNLISGTQYYWKIMAKDDRGDSAESPVWEFTTMGAACPGVAIVEYAGKSYNTVQIGNQCWLKENLDVGTMIDRLTDPANNDTIEKYCYNNDTANCSAYGALYQWDEAMQYVHTPGAQGICPSGWHIPTFNEFLYLSAIVDSNGNALKAIGQGSGDGVGTNASGFSALIGGYRFPDGYFYDLGLYTAFWGSTEHDPVELVTRFPLDGDNGIINFIESLKTYGFNVRCIKD